MPSPPPARVLFLRPDTYGDLCLFEPVLRVVRRAWPQTELGVLIREPYADAAPLFPAEGVRWLTTGCDPYRRRPDGSAADLAELRAVVGAFAPDCVVAACAAQTWLEAAVATFLPGTRQVSLGPGLTDPVLRATLDGVLPVDWAAVYPEKIPVEPDASEWEKNLRLASALTGSEAPRWRPVAQVPEAAREGAARVLAAAGLVTGEYVACAAAGTANVGIKAWPADRYGETLAWLERERGIRALLIGQASEQSVLEAVRAAARQGSADPALWVGQAGEMPLAAGLLAAARGYFGNDTGAVHLAGALGRPVLSIFGGGHWPRFQPVARRSLTVVQELPCFGCAWDCHFADAPCVRTISVASVREALDRFLRDDVDGQAVFEAVGLEAGARALIDATTPQARFLREDRAARGRQIVELTAWLRQSEEAHGTQPTHFSRWAVHAPELPVASPVASEPEPPPAPEPEPAADLPRRLQASRVQEFAARAEAQGLARELSLTHRLLRFAYDPLLGHPRPRPALLTRIPGWRPWLRAALGSQAIAFRLDSCLDQVGRVVVSGWAFRRSAGWDGHATTVTLLFLRARQVVHRAPTTRVPRPDVAARFAGPRAAGATGLDGAGFTTEIPADALPARVGLEIVLRLECAGVVCKQSTGEQVWL